MVHTHSRRLFAATLATAAAIALTACSGASPTQTTSSEAPATGQTITVWHYFSDPNQVGLMDKYAQLFEAAYPGNTVDNVFVPYDQMNSKLIAAAGSSTGPDVAVFNGAEAATLVLGGALAPIDDQIAAWPDKAQLPNSVIHVIDGKTYAVQGYVNLLGLWYNQDILDQLGLQPPTTMDELESDMAAAKAAGFMGITLCGLPNSQGEWQAYPWLTNSGFTYDNLDQAALAKGLALGRDWVQKGYLSQESATWDQTVPFNTFTAGNTLFAENGNWQMGTAASDAKFKYGVVALPIGSSAGVYLGGEGEAVGAFSKNPDLAWKYIESAYLSPEGQLAAQSMVGSLPSRLDTAKDPSVTGNAMLAPFATTVANNGALYPAAAVPPAGVADVQTAMGQAWSAAISGQQSPDDAAATAIAAVKTAMGK
ncbi:MAG: extracellular solute-binding protein [Propionibacteriaceae bacterium]|nr:extracellular solute-binding protein [Propionibacteriaceae bacterium]